MSTLRLRSIAFVLGASLLAACYPKSAPPPAVPSAAVAKAHFPDATDASLAEGHGVFIASCNKCHDYPDVHAFAAADLEADVRRMAKDKAKLDEHQTTLLVQFALTANATK